MRRKEKESVPPTIQLSPTQPNFQRDIQVIEIGWEMWTWKNKKKQNCCRRPSAHAGFPLGYHRPPKATRPCEGAGPDRCR